MTLPYWFTGLYLHESGFLAGSPDGINEESVLEVKCPFTHRESKDLKVSLKMPPSKIPKRAPKRQLAFKDVKKPEPVQKKAGPKQAAPQEYIVNYCDKKNQWILNKGHRYYHQIQAQIHFTNMKQAHLFIWTPHTSEYFKIERDPDWGVTNIDKLIDFYINRFVPFVLENPDLIPPI